MATKKAAAKKAAPVEQKKKRPKTPPYKTRKIGTTLSAAVSDAISELTGLGEECREIVDNSGEKLAETQRIQTFGETADALEYVDEPSIPDVISGDGVDYFEQYPSRKDRGTSRSVRRYNAVSMLEAARDAAQDFLDEEDNADHDERDDVEQLVSDLDQIIADAENCEFPGMYG